MIYGDSGNNMPSYESIVQSANLYVYCTNDPINYDDINGLTLTLIGSGEEVALIYSNIERLTNDKLVLQQVEGTKMYMGVHRLEHGYGDLSIGTELVGRIIDNNAYDCKILFNYAMGK